METQALITSLYHIRSEIWENVIFSSISEMEDTMERITQVIKSLEATL